MMFTFDAADDGPGFRVSLSSSGRSRAYAIAASTQRDFTAFFARVAEDFGTRRPDALAEPAAPLPPDPRWRPLLTDSAHPDILSGYGDPAVLRNDDGWWLVATSNDAPDAFPILHSTDLAHWHPRGFVFARGQAPGWTATGRGASDFWAPEMARVGDEYWLAFTARRTSGALAIGLARAPSPAGPWTDNGEPLLTGRAIPAAALGFDLPFESGVIDPHVFVGPDGDRYLVWKEDSNGIWPRPLAMLLARRPDLIELLFDGEADRSTAALAAAMIGWINRRPPMTRFFAIQPLIEAALANWDRLRAGLASSGEPVAELVGAMTTRVRIQRLAADGRSLVGEPATILVNDQQWEGHLVEGPFVTFQAGRYWLFYAGNDFSTPAYGIGVAVADSLLGPYAKQPEPLLQSTRDWIAPGHASVAAGRGGKPHLFFHAFRPLEAGYNAFRALLTIGLAFAGDRVELVPPAAY